MRAVAVCLLFAGVVGCAHVSFFKNGGIATFDTALEPTYSTVWGAAKFRAPSLLSAAAQSANWKAVDTKTESDERLSKIPLRTRTELDHSYTFTPQSADKGPHALSPEEIAAVGRSLRDQVRELIATAGGRETSAEERGSESVWTFAVNYTADGASGRISGSVQRASTHATDPVTRVEIRVQETTANK